MDLKNFFIQFLQINIANFLIPILTSHSGAAGRIPIPGTATAKR